MASSATEVTFTEDWKMSILKSENYAIALSLIGTVIVLWILDVALWLTWFLRLIEIRSVFDKWLVNFGTWPVLLLAILCSLLLKKIIKKAS